MLFGQQKYFKYVNNGKYGIMDENLQIIIPARISEKIEVKDDKYVIGDSGIFYSINQEDSKDKILTIDDKIVYDFRSIPDFKKTVKSNYLNNDIFSIVIYKSNVFTPICFLYDVKNQKVYEVSKGKAIYVDGITNNSSDLIPLENGSYFSLLTGKEVYKKNNRYYVYPFVNNRAVVGCYKNGKLTFQVIDSKNNLILDNIEQTAMCFSENLLPVLLENGQSGYVDLDGKLIINCSFFLDYDNWYETYGPKEYPVLHAYQHNGCAVVQKAKDDWAIVPQNEKAINISQNFQVNFEKFENNLLPVLDRKTNLYGFINQKGKLEISCQYEEVYGYNGKYWLVKQDNKDALLSQNGEIIFINDLKNR